MKRLTGQEFNDRLKAIKRSEILFKSLEKQKCPHCKKEFKASINTTEVFQAYQLLLAEQDRTAFISTYQMPYMPDRATPMCGFDPEKRPKCPKCGQRLMFMPNIGQLCEKANPAQWQTAWMCPDTNSEDKDCWYIHYSKKTTAYWINRVKKGIIELKTENKDDKITLHRDDPCNERLRRAG